MTVRELREKYLRFFESKGHLIHDSGSLIPYDVTGRLDESLLFNGAGMVQFKPYFRGIAEPPRTRVTTAQKCVRTGDIDEVGDDSHLTFFEMLGNFSFGDYFKLEAIDYSWEFLTGEKWLNLDPTRLSFTVFDNDDEAYNKWADHLTKVGIDPTTRIFRLGEETNYWPAGAFSKGPPGPCGPNSEMFYWNSNATVPGIKAGDYSREQWLADDDAKNWLEIWNDVFIQYEWQGTEGKDGWEKTGMPNLPFQSIDTGMGIERTVAVLNGYRSVYETDAFSSIFDKIKSLNPTVGSPNQTVAERVIADHIRTACFCIADGILPANNGRGYVLRRLIRRAVLKGQRTLGFNELFLYKVADAVFDIFGEHYKELGERKGIIQETLKNEEALFRRTLNRGSELLSEFLEKVKTTLPGDIAFQLYDTFGFPLEVTQELCNEAGITVDLEGYKVALAEAQDRSRGAQGDKSAYGDLTIDEELKIEGAPDSTDFLGYQHWSATGDVVRVRNLQEGHAKIALSVTPFYAESGGQTGDTGKLLIDGKAITVTNTTKSSGTFWHDIIVESVGDLLGKTVQAEIDSERRARIQRNHTATHLLQAALRQVLGNHVTQAGSYNGPENLRFDFTHGKGLTRAEIDQIEQIVNSEVLKNTPVTTYVDLPIDEARAKGAMALFGEKYGDKVRMVEIGEFSKELCGGTHVRTTGEIGSFRIVSESSAASGVRRIEAITGEAAYALAKEESERLKEAAGLLKSTPKDLIPAVEKVIEQLKEERKKREKAEMAALTGETSKSEVQDVQGIQLWVKNFGESDIKIATQSIDNEANGKANQVTLGVITGEKVTFVCKVGSEAVAKGAHAGNLLRELAKMTGGGGGGRADYATAGGKETSKVDQALSSVAELLKTQINS